MDKASVTKAAPKVLFGADWDQILRRAGRGCERDESWNHAGGHVRRRIASSIPMPSETSRRHESREVGSTEKSL